MDLKHYKAALEAVLFAYGEPITAARIAASLEIETAVVERLLVQLKDELDGEDRGIMLLQLEDRYQISTKAEYGSYVKTALDTRRSVPLGPAALEVLAIIAYNQPVSRGFIEQVRGVDSSSTVQSLVQKGLIEEAGRLDLPGKPISFRTTDVFLRTFGISALSQLPPLHDEEENEKENTTQQNTQEEV
ncbi:MAG: SMC-Scp complex subunit ScpB [Oscillospiraceae bacterium]|nr:SMC-Scp complex subunit ScpB [Oscillospiraceae bacterium]